MLVVDRSKCDRLFSDLLEVYEMCHNNNFKEEFRDVRL